MSTLIEEPTGVWGTIREALRGAPFGDLLRALAKGEVSLYQHEPCPWLSGPGRPDLRLER